MNARVEEALESLKSGKPEDVDRALESLQETVYGFGMKVCGVREDAEDTAQETLLRLARQLKEFPDARALAVWLYKVARSQCLMSRRKSKFAPAQMLSLDALMPKESAAATPATKSWEITPEEIVLNKELRGKLEDAIHALPPHYRMVLILTRHGTARHPGSGGGHGHFRGNRQDAPAPGERFSSQCAGWLCPAFAEEKPCLSGVASRSSPCSPTIWMVSFQRRIAANWSAT